MVTPLTGFPPLSVTLHHHRRRDESVPAAVFPGCCVKVTDSRPVPPRLVHAAEARRGCDPRHRGSYRVGARRRIGDRAHAGMTLPASVVVHSQTTSDCCDAAVDGAAKVTVDVPLSGLLGRIAHLHLQRRGERRQRRAVVLCGLPPETVMLDAGPAVIVNALLCADTKEVPTAVS